MGRQKRRRGLRWWMIFIISFVVASYLLRERTSTRSDSTRLATGGAKEDGMTERSTTPQFLEDEHVGELGIGQVPLLTQLNGDRWQSPAGLIYLPVGSEGHRLRELAARISEPDSSNGEFGLLGDLAQLLLWIDLAYRNSKIGDSQPATDVDGQSNIRVQMPSEIGWIRQPSSGRVVTTRWLQVTLKGNEVLS
ncbi:MAG: hypothetical protein VXZ53_14485, partial [Planctomycetota bacterium]|nr:hypothetical protein [Planctomycetota bacterium]